MARLDRAEVVELLGRLGAENQEIVLDAARELHRKTSEAGLTWDELLRAKWEPAAQEAEGDDTAAEPVEAETPIDDEAEVSDADRAEATRIIGRLLGRKDISGNLREDLTEMKRAIAEGDFDAMDRRYVRALAKRLGA